MNYIIPDTNLFYGKFYLTGKEWRYLLEKHLEEDFQIHVPWFIVKEVAKKYMDSLKEGNENLLKEQGALPALKKLKKSIRGLEVALSDISIEDEDDLYNIYLLTLLNSFESLNITVSEYPKTAETISNICDRYFDGKKPFSEDGKKNSFPDAIIWCSILELASFLGEGDCIHFITENKNDFAKNQEKKDDGLQDLLKLAKNLPYFVSENRGNPEYESNFHSDFDDDLEKLGDKKIYLYDSVKDFWTKHEYGVYQRYTNPQKHAIKLIQEIKKVSENETIKSLVIDSGYLKEEIEDFFEDRIIVENGFLGDAENLSIDFNNIHINMTKVDFEFEEGEGKYFQFEGCFTVKYSFVRTEGFSDEPSKISSDGRKQKMKFNLIVDFELDEKKYKEDQNVSVEDFITFTEVYIEDMEREIEGVM